MTALADSVILSTLQTAVIAAVEASPRSTLPIKLVAIDFTPPNDQKWLEVIWLPNNRNGDYWGTEQNYRGSLRLILHWPNNANGPYDAIELLAAIVSPFNKDALLQDIQIYDNPDCGGVLENGSENLYPATIRYQCFKR